MINDGINNVPDNTIAVFPKSGTYLKNSTDDSDFILADDDAIQLYIQKGIEIAAPEVGEDNIMSSPQSQENLYRTFYTAVTRAKKKLVIQSLENN
jgi:superfamily I DNA/RNA helicase